MPGKPPSLQKRLVERFTRLTTLSEADRFEVELFLHFSGVGSAMVIGYLIGRFTEAEFHLTKIAPRWAILSTLAILSSDYLVFWPLTRWVRASGRHDRTVWVTGSWIVLTQVHTTFVAHLYGTTQSAFLLTLPFGALITTALLGPRRGLFNMLVAFVCAGTVLALEKAQVISYAPLNPNADPATQLTYWNVLTVFAMIFFLGLFSWLAFAFISFLLEENQRQLQTAREQILRSQSLAATRALIDGAAHELRNPLSGATSILQSLSEDLTAQPGLPEDFRSDSQKALSLARASLGRIAAISEQLVLLSNTKNLAPRPVSVPDALERALRRLEKDGHAFTGRLGQQVPDKAVSVLGQPQLVEVALYHLLRNARQATRSGGDVAISIQRESGEVRVVCEDSGAGVAPGLEGTLFQPFVSGRDGWEGVGLGLYLVQEVARAFGGEVVLESPRGPTRFKITWPEAG